MPDPLLVFNAMVAAVALGAHLGLYASRSPAPIPIRTPGPIQWGQCDPSITNDTSLACGFFDVPLDYHDAAAGSARLAVIKASATATGERRGTLFFNPGGPGISGVQRLAQNKDALLAIGGGVYDVVSWDLRGVGDLTTPGEVRCFPTPSSYTALFANTIGLTGIDELGDFADPADVRHLLDQAAEMESKYDEAIRKCLASPSGRFLRYVGAAAAVRDMVSLADALDGPGARVNYVGVSYGTLVGSWMVNMFPERVGRVILDSILDPLFFASEEPSTRWVPHQLVLADTVYQGLLTGCALAGPHGCAAAAQGQGDGPPDVDAKIQRLFKALYDATKRNESVPMTSGQLRNSLFALMNAPGQWAAFMNDVYPQLVESVGPSTVAPSQKRKRTVLSHPLLKRGAPAQAPSYASTAILCGDSADEHGTSMADVFESVIDASRDVSHLFAATWPFVPHQCLHWPVRAVERYQGPFDRTPAHPVLISANTYDPITPLKGAEVLAGLLGRNGVLVHKKGFGHTMFAEPSACINSIYAAYVVNGTLPANNTVCDIDDDFEVFKGVTTNAIVASLQSAN